MSPYVISQVNLGDLRNYCSRNFGIINRNISRYYMTPVRPLGPPRPFGGGQPGQGNNDGVQQQQQQGGNNQVAAQEPRLINEGFVDPRAKLGRPKTLLMLWHEFLHGLDGNKPAKDFTPTERGRQKHKYSRRKSFWSVMLKLINAGYDELSAIDLIQQAYGTNLSVTKIIEKLQRAKSVGYHPQIANVIGA